MASSTLPARAAEHRGGRFCNTDCARCDREMTQRSKGYILEAIARNERDLRSSAPKARGW